MLSTKPAQTGRQQRLSSARTVHKQESTVRTKRTGQQPATTGKRADAPSLTHAAATIAGLDGAMGTKFVSRSCASRHVTPASFQNESNAPGETRNALSN